MILFSFRKGTSWFHRLDPGSKFVWLACVSALCLREGSAAFQGALLLAVLGFGAIAAGLSPKALWQGLRIPFWFGVPYFLLQLLALPDDGPPLFVLGPIVVSAGAFDFAAAVSLRLLTLVLASFVWIATTDPRDAVLALAQQLRVPYRFAYAVSIALRFLPILEAEAEAVRAAQRLRGYGGSTWRRPREKLAAWGRFGFAAFANAVRRVRQTAETMDARGFGLHPGRTYRRTLIVPRSGLALIVGSAAATAAVFLTA
ncbi:energy-coupling factor transporter transmembrane component T [Paenibacillus sp.]|uniref:energy-coupling factor transporter transmembrane component T family protein n=1 Tax=Paenibacillus sp. TaxID=58172 RepID=UPI002D249763|nr:energy-coupling factor transporter transmembrane component T [Paenibacillus sp.]HZG55358.1 energy-coupling factor transporter transmembrane component T [Paenibacillus sp.]